MAEHKLKGARSIICQNWFPPLGGASNTNRGTKSGVGHEPGTPAKLCKSGKVANPKKLAVGGQVWSAGAGDNVWVLIGGSRQNAHCTCPVRGCACVNKIAEPAAELSLSQLELKNQVSNGCCIMPALLRTWQAITLSPCLGSSVSPQLQHRNNCGH